MEDSLRTPCGPDDAYLLKASRREPEAFEALFDRHAVAMSRWLVAKTGDVAVAHDLLAETFAQAWIGVRRFRGDTDEAAAAWLYGIARNLVRQHYRRGRIENRARERLCMRAVALDDGGIEDVPARLDAAELSPAVRDAFAELTEEQQMAIGYRVVEQLTYEEIADRLDCSPATARARVFRGLRTLRSAVTKGS